VTKPADDHSWGSTAFLLAQVGAYAAEAFRARVSRLELTPAQAGLLRMLARIPGRSQRAYATYLGMPPSRFVMMVDALEDRGVLERRRGTDDRRANELHLTPTGHRLMRELGAVARSHESDLLAALKPSEQRGLRELLVRVAEAQGLTPGAHPGYRTKPHTE